jgi:signal transduction histidine kinase
MTRIKVLAVLAVGFGLIMALLIAVAYIDVRRSRLIESNASRLLRDHSAARGLLDAVDTEHRRLSGILVKMAHDEGRVSDRDSILEQVTAGNGSVHALARSAPRDREQWAQLETVSTRFSQTVKEALGNGQVTPAELANMLNAHVEFTRVASDLLRSDADNTDRMETGIGQQSEQLIGESTSLLAVCILVGIACAGLAIHVTNDAFQKLEWSTAELKRVSWHMLQGQEAAARRFSHELHDELGQQLTGLKATLTAISESEFSNRRSMYLEMLDQSIKATRELSQLLRPVLLDDFGLHEGLRWLAEGFQERTGIAVNYSSNFSGRLADDTETQLFRIAQESLTNIARHSGATQVNLALSLEKRSVHLLVEDNGCGLPKQRDQKSPSLGMIGMRARANQAGGELRLATSNLGGVQIQIDVPYRERTQHDQAENPHFVGG